MTPPSTGTTPVNPSPAEMARVLLGTELRAIRIAAGKTTRQIAGYSSGHISNVEAGKVTPSERLILAYSSLGGSHAQLIGLLRQAHSSRTLAPVVADALEDPLTDPHVLRRGYVIEMIEDIHYYGERHQPLRNVHRVSLRFTSPRARFFPFRHVVDEDLRKGVSHVQPSTGCEIAHLEEADDGVIYCVLAAQPDALDELGRTTISWVIDINTDAVGHPRVDAGSSGRIPLATKRVQFHADAPPSNLWWYRETDPSAASLSAARRNKIPPNTANLATREFINIDREWWGIAWTWPPISG
ncbi:helix-turn-helix domain-containing protein [Nocardioides humilatus]|uniref:Helix-turn-helix domain-containing protein n=1 Tax=Nocardioides humilatus TaxID=2607660 RepID=A0A5B1L6R8_9ACTN|nr:helix-turn-helix transcriptional regulator [Nocardioides humilatus]KAA1415357.1 helix-turn-helix domain-containing protein [Nocardioides humilatus]